MRTSLNLGPNAEPVSLNAEPHGPNAEPVSLSAEPHGKKPEYNGTTNHTKFLPRLGDK